ncbi:hypothetical protein [Rhizobium sp. PDO1-076]|uniref:hypothetical protein n=1 Tax=Rhizobium sp. PDO1-076 TaxID=1125979 RepID=UPI0011470C34|nr:hypothetical protein [Rhizobium sp. PDO1-076]
MAAENYVLISFGFDHISQFLMCHAAKSCKSLKLIGAFLHLHAQVAGHRRAPQESARQTNCIVTDFTSTGPWRGAVRRVCSQQKGNYKQGLHEWQGHHDRAARARDH